MATLRTLCVYCGSRSGRDPAYGVLAEALGARCARAGVALVYGGGHIGLMGRLSDAATQAGGHVTGIIPEHLMRREVADTRISTLDVVDSMHTRKERMAALADAFCVLPGGLGTLDETLEILTWKQLGLHDKPIVLLDHGGYWRPFLDMLDHQAAAGFVDPAHRALFEVAEDLDGLFDAVARQPEPTITGGGACM